MKVSSLEAILRALAEADARYLIVGGLAVAAHGYGRLTFDLDLVVQLQPDNVKRALAALESLGYVPLIPVTASDFADPKIRDSWIREKNAVVFQLHSENHKETRIDLFVSEPFDFDEEYLHARVGELVPGLPVRFVRIETLIEMKEQSGRPKDLGWSTTIMPDEITSKPLSTRDAWRKHNLSQLIYFRSLSLREKFEAVEGMAEIVHRLERMRLAEKKRRA